MKTILFKLIAVSSLLAVASCGASGSGTGSDFIARSPVAGMSMSDLQQNTGVKDGTDTLIATGASVGGVPNDNLTNTAGIVRRFNGVVNFSSSKLNSDGTEAEQGARLTLDSNGGKGDGTYNPIQYQSNSDVSQWVDLNPSNNTISTSTGQAVFSQTTKQIGGATAIVASSIPAYNQHTIVYVPASAAQKMYAGAYVTNQSGAGIMGIFGQKTTSAQLSAQTGKATYSGIAAAVVNRAGANGVESGLFTGTATGNVDFGTKTITTSSTVTRPRHNSTGSDSITMTTSGNIDANGHITGTSSATGLVSTGAATGTIQGDLFGPNADTVGITATSRGTDINSQPAGAATTILMNKN